MALANEIGLRYLTFTSNQNPTTSLAKCALLDSTNTRQNLPISGDVGISLPSVDTTKTIGIYYGTYISDLTNISSTILGAQINPGDVLITLFGGQNASFYADNRNMRGLGRLYATASSDSISVAGVVKGVNRLLGVEKAWANCGSVSQSGYSCGFCTTATSGICNFSGSGCFSGTGYGPCNAASGSTNVWGNGSISPNKSISTYVTITYGIYSTCDCYGLGCGTNSGICAYWGGMYNWQWLRVMQCIWDWSTGSSW